MQMITRFFWESETQMNERTNGNFADALASVAEAHPQRQCLILDDGSVWSYADLTAWSQRMAGALQSLGVARGDRVLVQVEKSAHAVALYLGCLRLGAVYVPLNTAYTPEEVDYFLGDAAPCLYVSAASADAPGGAVACALARGIAVSTLGGDGTGTLLETARAAAPVRAVEPCGQDELAAIVYTSGTTGRSKGAMLSHRNLHSNAQVLLTEWGWRDDDVLLHALPIFHVHGLFVAMHCALLSATPMIFMARFDAAAVLDALPHATVMMGVPTFYSRLLESPALSSKVCRRIRLFISGSAPLTEQTFAAFEASTGHRILERYGMSETMMITSNPLLGDRVPGTVGFPLPGVEVRIAAADGTLLGPGEVGVIEVRGPNVCSGYWRMPDKTVEEFRSDGFFITGDLGTMDEHGRVAIVGRSKDLVISGGYNVYPKEIERLLDELAGVAESAVIGVPHPDFGEAVVALLVTDPAQGDPPSEAAVRAALDGRLARFKLPKATLYVDALPRNAMGKVQKNELRTRFAHLFAEPAS
jgi:malonyl-CoA/methylmalonyl-CoA synthetase